MIRVQRKRHTGVERLCDEGDSISESKISCTGLLTRAALIETLPSAIPKGSLNKAMYRKVHHHRIDPLDIQDIVHHSRHLRSSSLDVIRAPTSIALYNCESVTRKAEIVAETIGLENARI